MDNKINQSHLSSEDEDFIRNNYLEKTVTEMSTEIGKNPRAIYVFMGWSGLKTLTKRVAKIKKRVPEGYFDFDERDWFIGDK